MSLRTLTERELNRAVLARQMLLERVDAPLPAVLERMGGLQPQYAPAMYVGLWSRIAGFERPELDTALDAKAVVQGTLLRGTIHLVSAADYWPLAVAIRWPRRRWWLGAHRGQAREQDMEASASTVRKRLAGGPASRKELGELAAGEGWNGVGLWVDLVRVPPSGTWTRRRADTYALATAWLADGPAAGAATMPVAEALDHLVRRYLTAFGPSTVRELALWAGMTAGELAPEVAGMELRRYRAEDGAELVDLPGSPLPPADTLAPVRFLGAWDALLLVHARRKGVVAEEHRPVLFTSKNPQSFNTVLVDGSVAATWAYRDGHIEVEPLRPLSSGARREVRDEAERLSTLYA